MSPPPAPPLNPRASDTDPAEVHPLLRRQLKRAGLDPETPPSPEGWQALLDRVSRTYADNDQDRYTMERSLMISSHEMQQLYDELRTRSEAELGAKHEELRLSLARSEAIRESVIDGVLLVEPGMRVSAFNRRFLEMWSVPEALAEAGAGEALLAHITAQMTDPADYVARARALEGEPDAVVRLDVRLTDGRTFDVYSGPVRTDDRTFGRIVCYRDVTEQRRLDEDRLVVSERMASLGRLVACVAHEINNPLTYVQANLGYLAESGADRGLPELRAALREALDGVERIRCIVGDLRLLSRPQREPTTRVDVHDVLDAAVQMAAHAARHHARVERRYGGVVPVAADPVRLGQVFLNLVVNAAQAVEETRSTHGRILVSTGRTPAGWVRVEVADTGPGIRPEHKERIFDPFFTTKPSGAGTGLGLSICRSIVESVGGTIRVESEPGRGARFVVELPPAAGARPTPPPEPLRPQATRGGRVLVVDDEPEIRSLVRRLLQPDHEVVACESAREALDRLSWDADFDVLLCDLMMPETSGAEFVADVEARWPHLMPAVLFMTGGVFTPTSEALLAGGERPVLHKPFTPAELRDRLSARLPSRS